jgi:hypothetical protein
MSDERLQDIVQRLRGFLTADYALIARHRADEKRDRDITGDVEDLLSRLGGHAAGEGRWLPIESAPRDGTEILIANDRIVHEVRWMVSADKGAPDGGWFVGGYSGWRLTWKPNKWMPLPSTIPADPWMPIQTAPRGVTILLGSQGLEGWLQMTGYWAGDDWYFIGGGLMGVNPTHWMPLYLSSPSTTPPVPVAEPGEPA